MTKASKLKFDDFEHASLNAGYLRNEGERPEAEEAEEELDNARAALVKRITLLEKERADWKRECRILSEYI